MYVRTYVRMYVCMAQTSTSGVLLLKPLLVDFVDWGSRKTPQLDCGWVGFVCFWVGGFIRFAVDWIEGVGFSCCAT